MTESGPQAGSTANHYEILAKLAVGGMAEIFLARTESQAGVERHVVLKRVLGHRASDIQHVHMFLDEARLAAQLQHPNIAQVFDTGKLGNSYFFTMEYVHGETARELMHRAHERDTRIPIGCAMSIIAGAAAGLQHAHDRLGTNGEPLGIVHRDVSPSNLMISYEGHVKVVDFGVAKAASRSVETQTGTVKGKIGYMAPEQCRGGIVDRRCDLFCLGIVMWEILVGQRLFKRATDFESMEAIDREPAPAPSSLRAEIPPELDEIVLTLLEKSPDDRYQTAHELLEDLERVASTSGIAMSATAVRRLVRDLFGVRPEPWIELRRVDDRSEVVTVTGAPVSSQLGELELDTKLERLRDLSLPVHDDLPARVPSPATPLPRLEAPHDAADDVRPAPRRSWGLAVLAVAGIAVAVVAGVYVGQRTRATTSAPVASVRADADAASASASAPAPAPDAASTVAIAPPAADAAVEPALPVAAPDVEALWDAGRHAEVLAACEGDPALAAVHAPSCTLAACRAHRAELARTLLAHVAGAQRRSTVERCRGYGTRLAVATTTPPRRHPHLPNEDPPELDPKHRADPVKGDPAVKKACDDPDPMACRH